MPNNKELFEILANKNLTSTEKNFFIYISAYIEENQRLLTLTNGEFGEIFGKTVKTVSNTINSLYKKKLIDLKYDYERVRYVSLYGDERFNVTELMTSEELLRQRNLILEKKENDKDIGYIYILKSEYGYKIGKSIKVKDRIALFNVKLPFEFDIEGYYKVVNMSATETYLHKKYGYKRLEGEWFDLSEDDVYTLKKELFEQMIL